MYIAGETLSSAIKNLRGVHAFFGFAFPAFKRAGLPVGFSADVNFSSVMNGYLDLYFRPFQAVSKYYSPFSSSRPGDTWLAERYGNTSLQRIVADTFSQAFLHEKGTSKWGWVKNYVNVLEEKIEKSKEGKIPLLSLACWLYRDVDFGKDLTRVSLAQRLISDFFLTEDELSRLFFVEAEHQLKLIASEVPLSVEETEGVLGSPPGVFSRKGARLNSLGIRSVGPLFSVDYCPSARLNIVTGDNSLGKSLLLDAVWWALTGTWAGGVLMPPLNSGRDASIKAVLSGKGGAESERFSKFSWKKRQWETKAAASGAALVIYSRHDGSALVWDRAASPDRLDEIIRLRLSPEELRNGKFDKELGITLCNGLLRDWVSWQANPSRYKERWEALESALEALSPDDVKLKPGSPVKIPPNEAELPTIKMPYGDILLSHASAATARVLSLAYIFVWAWYRHLDSSRSYEVEPSRSIVVIVDELEAHLHPKWQRTVLPSLQAAVARVSSVTDVQLHVATHSPLVMASVEPIFDSEMDSLFKIDFSEDGVDLHEVDFNREGSVDRWLTSEVFGLSQSRSLVAERAIEAAHGFMLSKHKNSTEALEIHRMLLVSLAQDDEFWPRWLPYVLKFGVLDAADSFDGSAKTK